MGHATAESSAGAGFAIRCASMVREYFNELPRSLGTPPTAVGMERRCIQHSTKPHFARYDMSGKTKSHATQTDRVIVPLLTVHKQLRLNFGGEQQRQAKRERITACSHQLPDQRYTVTSHDDIHYFMLGYSMSSYTMILD